MWSILFNTSLNYMKVPFFLVRADSMIGRFVAPFCFIFIYFFKSPRIACSLIRLFVLWFVSELLIWRFALLSLFCAISCSLLMYCFTLCSTTCLVLLLDYLCLFLFCKLIRKPMFVDSSKHFFSVSSTSFAWFKVEGNKKKLESLISIT